MSPRIDLKIVESKPFLTRLQLDNYNFFIVLHVQLFVISRKYFLHISSYFIHFQWKFAIFREFGPHLDYI